MANSKKKSGPKAGDATGRTKAALEAEQAEASLRRQEELTMINQQVSAEAQHGVFDPRSGGLLNDEDVKDAPEVVPADSAAAVTNVSPDGTEGEQSDAVEVLDVGVETARPQDVVIRVNETLTNVTVGAGTNFNFEEGKKYKVPRHVALHLEEKGYIWH